MSQRSEALLIRSAASAVALETAVFTGGLPPALRGETAARMAAAIRARQAEPAFVGVVDGQPIVGLTQDELQLLIQADTKLSRRDLAAAMSRRQHGGTTVAATVFLSGRARLAVAVTGGIGGVHPAGGPPDISADLAELARTPVILVCSGAKAITDVPATLERLDTLSIAVVAFGTDEIPAFWTAETGLAAPERVDEPGAVAAIWKAARALEVPGALLVCVPPPQEFALSRAESDGAVARALEDLRREKVAGAAVTPFLLARVAEYTAGRSLRANVALLERNASVAGAIARALAEPVR